MKTGTPVDAAIIASAGEDDEEGDWVKHKGRPAFQCFKAHVGAYADTALVEEIAVTAPTPRTTRPFLMLCPTIPAKCLPTAPTEAIISATRWAPRVEGRASSQPVRGGATRPKARRLDQPIHRICSRIEKIFGTWKRSYDLRPMRWRGLAKAAVQIRRTAIAYSAKHSLMVASSRPSLKPSHRFRARLPKFIQVNT
ncbi:transposase [Mesorhizobium sp. M1142]|uniref:transposase n=1 Tax=Mesorhizobium sp. M1142 TaxID=2957060 RepID=UPI00333632C6